MIILYLETLRAQILNSMRFVTPSKADLELERAYNYRASGIFGL